MKYPRIPLLLLALLGFLPAAKADPITIEAGAPGGADEVNEVARLGAELFGRHLFAVEVAGVLLLVALVGAIAVVSRGEATEADHRREV